MKRVPVVELSLLEFIIVIVLASLFGVSLLHGLRTVALVLGLALGGWLVSRPAQVLVRGVEGLMTKLRVSEWAAGLISAFATASTELFIVLFTVIAAWREYHVDVDRALQLLDVTFLGMLFSIYINLSLIGILLTCYLRLHSEPVRIPREVLQYIPELIFLAFIVLFLIPFLPLFQAVFRGVPPNGHAVPTIPKVTAALLPPMYLLYAVIQHKRGILAARVRTKREEALLRQSLAQIFIGVSLTAVGAQLIVTLIEDGLRMFSQIFVNPVIAFAFCVAVISAISDFISNTLLMEQREYLASVSNLLNSSLQVLFIVIAVLALLSPTSLRVNPEVAWACLGLSMLFLYLRLLTGDRSLDWWEAASLTLLSLLILSLIFSFA